MKFAKKILVMLFCFVLGAVLAVGGTIAWLTDDDGAVNVMVVGKVKIAQNEYQREMVDGVYTGKLQDFEQFKRLRPVVVAGGASKEAVTVGNYTVSMRDEGYRNYVDKIVTVSNVGNENAYVRTVIAIPELGVYDAGNASYNNWFHWNGVSDTDTDPANGWMWGNDQATEWPGNEDGWDSVPRVMIDGRPYTLFIATNKNVLKPGEQTAPNLVGFYLDERVDFDGENYYIVIDGEKKVLGSADSLNVLVKTQAVQSDGFDNAWAALDAAFGDVTATAHPWVDFNMIPPVVSETDGTYSMTFKNDALLVNEPFLNFTDDTLLNAPLTVNGNGKTVTMYTTDAQQFDWVDGRFPTQGTIFSTSNGEKVTVNNLAFSGTMQTIMLGHYVDTRPDIFNTELNNVDVVGVKVVSFSQNISPAVCVYGTATLNNCKVYGTTLSPLDTDPAWPAYDIACVNYSNLILNGSEVGTVYMWNQAKVTVANGSSVDTVVVRGNMNLSTSALVVKAGASVDVIDLSAITNKDKVSITIEDGATVGAFVANGVTYATLADWQNG